MAKEIVEDLGMIILSQFSPEMAHDIGIWAMKKRILAPGRFSTWQTKTNLFDVEIDNPFGIAAGFDKYAEIHDVVQDYGFIESGSYTFRGGEGNKKPRMFRDEQTGGMINRMGLNCIPAEVAAERFSLAENPYSFAVSIAKTHDQRIVGDLAIQDIADSYELLRGFGIYTVINVSCPNTTEGKTFEQDPGTFAELVEELRNRKRGRPLVFKFSPNLNFHILEELVSISYDVADGYEATNTLPVNYPIYGKGGMSGPILRDYSRNTVDFLRELSSSRKTFIGCGGISTEQEALEMEQVGAEVFLVYNGFVHMHKENPHAGLRFAHKINQGLIDLR